MINYKYPFKTKRIKIYYEEIRRNNEQNVITAKVYIHPAKTTISAYVRQVTEAELGGDVNNYDGSIVEFVINANKRKITTDMFVEFKDNTYQIKAPDYLEFNETEIKFKANKVSPKDYDLIEYKRWQS